MLQHARSCIGGEVGVVALVHPTVDFKAVGLAGAGHKLPQASGSCMTLCLGVEAALYHGQEAQHLRQVVAVEDIVKDIAIQIILAQHDCHGAAHAGGVAVNVAAHGAVIDMEFLGGRDGLEALGIVFVVEEGILVFQLHVFVKRRKEIAFKECVSIILLGLLKAKGDVFLLDVGVISLCCSRQCDCYQHGNEIIINLIHNSILKVKAALHSDGTALAAAYVVVDFYAGRLNAEAEVLANVEGGELRVYISVNH